MNEMIGFYDEGIQQLPLSLELLPNHFRGCSRQSNGSVSQQGGCRPSSVLQHCEMIPEDLAGDVIPRSRSLRRKEHFFHMSFEQHTLSTGHVDGQCVGLAAINDSEGERDDTHCGHCEEAENAGKLPAKSRTVV